MRKGWLGRVGVLSAIGALTLLVPTSVEAGPKVRAAVTMYGASWCGPCKAVKRFFSANGIPHQYVDVDSSSGGDAFERANGGKRSIPLTFVGRRRVRGANVEALRQALEAGGYVLDGSRDNSDELYGGHAPQWWQSQFRELRTHLKGIQAEIGKREEAARFKEDFAEIGLLKAKEDLIESSLILLETDASRVALPRRYREDQL